MKIEHLCPGGFGETKSSKCVAPQCQENFSGDGDLGSSSSNLLFITTFEVKKPWRENLPMKLGRQVPF